MTTTAPLPPRQPRGIPAGGEYASYAHAEGDLTLQPAGAVIPDLIELTPETRRSLTRSGPPAAGRSSSAAPSATY
ncbi:hypothetical protein [Arthrobacter sp. 9MFCol3.1]|uniref:hypothetical protein n=1 Tax=Arthrobacter sp. 9MFCol3.1 TaxID=1150398 RepID=UPI00047EEA6C|nr:hypothetical protein [Arthrobacter sp. 9MFCol3.1]